MPSEKPTESKRQRLEEKQKNLQSEWAIRNEKLARLRRRLAIETSEATQFQLEQEIKIEKKDIEKLEKQLSEIERDLNSDQEIKIEKKDIEKSDKQLSEIEQDLNSDTVSSTAQTSCKKILLLSSNPLTSGRLRVDEEMREIRKVLQSASQREKFVTESVPALRYRDLNSEIMKSKPCIVHFSGHGMGTEIKAGEDPNSRELALDIIQSDSAGLILEDESGQIKLVNTKALARLFKLFADTVECVVLNACFSHLQAEAISEYIPYVVGMGKAIGDRAAIEFARAFYEALGDGRDYEWAFEYALSAIDLAGIPESDTPKLFKKKLSSPSP